MTLSEAFKEWRLAWAGVLIEVLFLGAVMITASCSHAEHESQCRQCAEVCTGACAVNARSPGAVVCLPPGASQACPECTFETPEQRRARHG